MAASPPTFSYDSLQRSPNQTRFLKCLAVCGSITVACRWAKLSRQAHYRWLDEDPTYEPRVKEALKRSATVLADEAVRRGYQGIRKAVRYKGKVVGHDIEYSDQLLIRMMEAREPETFAPRLKQEHTGKDGSPLFDQAALRDWIKNGAGE
jgi:hypothetical protein